MNYSITPSGMEMTNRNERDGIVFFGGKMSSPVDFIFPEVDEKEDDDTFPHFIIFFSSNVSSYYIQDLDRGLGTLMKINEFEIKERSLINIGESYIVLSFEQNINTTTEPEYDNTNNTTNRDTNITHSLFQPQTIITFKIFNSRMNNHFSKSFSYKASEISAMECTKPITIGRSSSCDISVEDLMLSKHQCTIKVMNNKWMIYDGDEEHPSTNGTWIYLVDPWKIEDNLFFKANHTLFEIAIVKK